jgi:hypothetical protein
MSRVTQVIADARSILADTAGDRWPDARLLSLYNQCLKDIIIQSKMLRGKAFVEIEANINTYKMPNEVLRIERVQYLDTFIPVMSHDKMDEIDYLWETKTGNEVKYVVTNLLNAGTFKIYPRITDTTMDYIDSNSNYGIIVDLTTFDDIFNLPNISQINDIPKYLVVYYTKIPDVVTISTIDTDLQINSAWDNAIIHYIAGMALRDDADQQNRAFGAEELQLYANNVINLIKGEMSNNVSNPNANISYRGAF